MSDTKVKPCPFCGGKSRVHLYLGKWYVQCKGKDCRVRTDIYETKEQAVAVWNRRVEK